MAQTILITGASSGLGEEMARQFADLGYDLALCARRSDRLETLRDELLRSHPHARVAVRTLDVTDGDRVFEVFGSFADELGGIDRVVVNAGIGKGARLGTGRYDANRATAMTNFLGGLAQVEAALELFRRTDDGRSPGVGHLVVVSSMSAIRGLPGTMTTYAASKAGIAHLAEGVRAELHGSAVRVTVLYPGFIESEMSRRSAANSLMMTSTTKGVAAMVKAIEARRAHAYVPRWPWAPLSVLMRHAPVALLHRAG